MARLVAVTGCCGFIGRVVTEALLKRGDYVYGVDALTYAADPTLVADWLSQYGPERFHFVCQDINALGRFPEVDAVINLAAETHVDNSLSDNTRFVATNINGVAHLLEMCRAMRHYEIPRFVQISTDEVYGSLGETGYFSETTPYDPRSPYSASKASSDHIVSAYHHTYGLPTLITNCSNNYGPYQFPEKLIPLIINNARNGKELPVYGDGKNIRDWLYVVDHCEAILSVLSSGKAGETYNIGGNSEKQNVEVVQTICDILDEQTGCLPGGQPRRTLIRFVKDRPGHDRRYAIDASKISRELGWQPAVRFEEGIRQTIKWYLENPAWISSVIDGSYREYYEKMYGNR